jgi:dCMP deaminase
MESSKRATWIKYFMKIAYLVATRSTCIRGDRGCVLVKDWKIIATGYNGVPQGFDHCTHDTCEREKQSIPSGSRLDICNGLHAEENAILQVASSTLSTIGCSIFVTVHPCTHCAKLIIGAGIENVYYSSDYDNNNAKILLQNAKINVIKVE